MKTTGNEIIQLAQNVLDTEAKALKSLAGQLPKAFPELVETILQIKGRVIVAGMGKSGHIGKKISATLSSTGTPSYFLHASEASHGDLGMIVEDDLCVLISNSGETPELKNILSHLKRFSIPLASISSTPESTLAQAANYPLNLPKEPEVCAIGLAPTTSTTMTLALGDALAVSLMRLRKFNIEQFQILHPGGKLGEQMVRIEDLMYKEGKIPIVTREMPMAKALLEMTSKGFGYAVIVENKFVTGVISDGDLRRHINNLLEKNAGEISTNNPITVRPEIFATEALKIMNENKIGVLVVTDKNNELRGILHIQDLLRAGII